MPVTVFSALSPLLLPHQQTAIDVNFSHEKQRYTQQAAYKTKIQEQRKVPKKKKV